MKEHNEENNLEVAGFLAKSEEYIQRNKKTLTIVVCCVVGVALLIWAFIAFYAQPRQQRAAESMFAAEQYFSEGNYELALNGNDDNLGFADIIDQYGCTKSANLAKYYAGICQLNLGKYDEAIDLLKHYKGRDLLTKGEALMLIGDAYAEKADPAEAIRYYEKAAKASQNFVVAPTALWKAGMMHMQQNEYDKAVECFQQVKDNYPESSEYAEMDKYISYAETLSEK